LSETPSGTPAPAIVELAARLQEALGAGYEVERPLGAGGFAVVFLVRDLQLKRRLAVKVLSPDLITSKTVLERFRREAETIARLSHPNIVPLYFIGQKDELLFLAMECVEGGSLADRLEREGRLPIADAKRLLVDVASGLAHAHRRGVVHRDIKPQNVLLDGESGRALVTDFGIARVEDSTSLTATGMVLGTPAYLAPEQVTGDPSDHRSDIYAFGVLAYEVLAGRPPFQAAIPSAVLLKRLAGPPEPVTSLRADVPPELHEIIQQCLAVDPAERFQSADDVVRSLTGQTPPSGGHNTTERRIERRKQRRIWAGASIGGAVLLTGWIIWSQLRPGGGGPAPAVPAGLRVDAGMVLVPAGDYLIGYDSGPARANARPVHRVRLEAFGLDRHEVSVGEYQQYVDSMRVPSPWSSTAMPEPVLPVTRVGYVEATKYCRWKHPAGGRLPTEEEWEAAARGSEGRRFPWGNAQDAGRANTGSARRNALVAVGTFAGGATPEGIVDLIGNVWEWTSSPAHPYRDGPGMPGSGEQSRIVRGGAFNNPDSIATVWWRNPFPISTRPELLFATGFRCATTPRAESSAER
jgi:formylglycine-generating enzyme required for sulfatase activity/tRNA A-37 threonylcarbamoyl transferase component Bud32